MTDLLLIVEADGDEEKLLTELTKRRADRVTVLVADGNPEWAADDSPAADAIRTKLANLLHAVELRTGATVVGLAGDRDQLRGWRFDRVVGSTPRDQLPAPLAA